MHSDFDCPAEQRGGHQLGPHGPWCFCMGGIAAWQAFSAAADVPDAAEANGGNGDIDPPRQRNGADLREAEDAEHNTANNAEDTRDNAHADAPEDWYGVDEDDDEDFDPVLAQRLQLEAAHRAQARLGRVDTQHAPAQAQTPPDTTGTETREFDLPSSSCRTEKQRRNPATGSPYSSGCRNSKESLHSRDKLETIFE